MSFRQFSFLTGPTKLDFVRIAVCTFTSLVGPLSFGQLSFLTEKNKMFQTVYWCFLVPCNLFVFFVRV